jgi:glycosyltransferase involved in cell wall biosynthesis
MRTMRRKTALIDDLRPFLTHFRPGRIVRFVKVFGFAAACQQVGIEVRQLITSVQGNNSDRRLVIVNHNGVEQPSELFENVTVSVVIPVKDAGDDFPLLLSSLTRQKGFATVEIVVVDSGSSDESVQIAREFGAKVIKISPEEFSHSRARNLAAENCSGNYILFTVQDALPSSDLWLHELFNALKNNGAAAVSCAEFPREDADLFYRACCWGHYKFLEVDGEDRILSKPDIENYFTLRKNGQLSDLACLISRDLFLKYKFHGDYAEDLELGLRLIKDGRKLAFLSSTRVIHSHNRPAYYHLKRGYVDGLLLCQIFSDCPILAIEPRRLLLDIQFTRRVMDSMIDRLGQIAIAATVTGLRKMAVDHYGRFSKRNEPGAVAAAGNGHMDTGFSAFLNDLHKRYGSIGHHQHEYDGILLDAMQSATNTILEYMDDVYETVDDTILEEFSSSLYKMFAFQCGTHLASCYLKGSDQTKRELEQINRELTQGV